MPSASQKGLKPGRRFTFRHMSAPPSPVPGAQQPWLQPPPPPPPSTERVWSPASGFECRLFKGQPLLLATSGVPTRTPPSQAFSFHECLSVCSVTPGDSAWVTVVQESRGLGADTMLRCLSAVSAAATGSSSDTPPPPAPETRGLELLRASSACRRPLFLSHYEG